MQVHRNSILFFEFPSRGIEYQRVEDVLRCSPVASRLVDNASLRSCCVEEPHENSDALVREALVCVALVREALVCVALVCVALVCVALVCVALVCVALVCVALVRVALVSAAVRTLVDYDRIRPLRQRAIMGAVASNKNKHNIVSDYKMRTLIV